MSHAVYDSNCYLGNEKAISGEIICLSMACMICKDGKWERTNKISVL